MENLVDIVRVIHIVNAILMAWPAYALVAVNHRMRLGPPLGDRVDVYLENVIRSRAVPCFVFQGTALVSGLALLPLQGLGFDSLVTNAALGLKFLLLLLVVGSLSHVYLNLQPRIDALFAQAQSPVPGDLVPRIVALRIRRKQMASVCMFAVLTAAVLGVQAVRAFPLWLAVVMIVAVALFTLRAYRSTTAYGWA